MEEKPKIPGGWNSWNSQKELNPDEWNSTREASNNQHDLGAIDKKEMIPGR